jgi:hypothetical protein
METWMPILIQATLFIGAIIGIYVNINVRLTRVETKIELWWKCVGENIVSTLKTFPTDIPRDILLDKLLGSEISLTEAQRLRTILKGELENTDPGKKYAYALALQRLESVIYDLGGKHALGR